MESPAAKAVAADLASASFRVGLARKSWRLVSNAFPLLVIAVTATDGEASSSEYFFRFELTGFPGVAPEVLLWDVAASASLAAPLRPKWSPRVQEAFKEWQAPHPVYRPWERTSGAHNSWGQNFPDLAWNPARNLSFILEDLHGLLTSQRSCSTAGAAA